MTLCYFSWFLSPITVGLCLVYGRYIELAPIVHKPTNITGVAPPCAMQGVGKHTKNVEKQWNPETENDLQMLSLPHLFLCLDPGGQPKNLLSASAPSPPA